MDSNEDPPPYKLVSRVGLKLIFKAVPKATEAAAASAPLPRPSEGQTALVKDRAPQTDIRPFKAESPVSSLADKAETRCPDCDKANAGPLEANKANAWSFQANNTNAWPCKAERPNNAQPDIRPFEADKPAKLAKAVTANYRPAKVSFATNSHTQQEQRGQVARTSSSHLDFVAQSTQLKLERIRAELAAAQQMEAQNRGRKRKASDADIKDDDGSGPAKVKAKVMAKPKAKADLTCFQKKLQQLRNVAPAPKPKPRPVDVPTKPDLVPKGTRKPFDHLNILQPRNKVAYFDHAVSGGSSGKATNTSKPIVPEAMFLNYQEANGFKTESIQMKTAMKYFKAPVEKPKRELVKVVKVNNKSKDKSSPDKPGDEKSRTEALDEESKENREQ